ncbi:MFS transporter [Goodfellowiella coeruleoviolacea]|uniref:Major Facilitator Superfamily protein n=1 Tax=Goodfellowiella coeruleoviolacea TaxID=334858 RepID=A0AAE3GC61_9PSEU|nr:MFS transporter [Goodfellowiella coeruleoviolacea]MCP2164715.1 Major Facilitator Superfamily protein [Goodfellowiella coeruleoviolacea]
MRPTGSVRAVLAHREFRGLWISATVSTVGDQLAVVALSLLVYARTQSAAWTATSYALTMLPTLVSGPLLAWLADRYPRRAVMVCCAWAQAALMAVMALPDLPLPLMIVLLVAVQMIASPFLAAQEATLPLALPARDYDHGVALFGSSADIAQMVGLASAGLVVTAAGPHTALAVNAATFVLVAVLVQVTCVARPAADPSRAARAGAPEGGDRAGAPGAVPGDGGAARTSALAVILGSPLLRSTLGLRLLAGFAMVPEGLAVPLADRLGTPWAAGLLLAVEPAGNVLGVLLLYRLVRDDRARERLVGPLAVVSLAPLIGFALHPNLPVTLVLLLVAAMAGAYHTPARAVWGRSVPDAYRGRAHGIARTALRASQGGGMAVGGGAAQLAGSVTTALAGAGVLGVLLAWYGALSWRRLHRMANTGTSA